MPKKPQNAPSLPNRFSELNEVLGAPSGIQPKDIDPTLLWMATCALLESGAALHVGLTRSKNGIVLKLYDGEFPRTDYLDTVNELHRFFRGIIRVYMKNRLPIEWETYLRNADEETA